MAKKKQDVWRKFIQSIWFFPAICLLVLVILTSLNLNGSSVGSYFHTIYGGNAKDSNVILGTPRSIRSDEWEWQLSEAAAQSKADFPSINKNIGDGQDMEVIVDAPFKSWTTIFKPQNLSFFVLPFSYAYAFKWWFLALALVVSCYLFILLLMPRRRLLAAILATAFFFSPFIQWWYQTVTVASIFYSFLIILAVIKLWQTTTKKMQIVWTLVLSYLFVCFAVVLYPPFQIPCALATAAFLLGYFLEKGFLKNKDILKRGLLLSAISLVIFGVLIGSFLSINKPAISASSNSIYPGKRIGTSGHFDAEVFFANFLDSQLQLSRKAKNYVANQSEASSFILLSPFLTIPALYSIARERRRKKQIDWPLLCSTGLFLLFMIRLFVPGTDVLFKPFFLGSVPNARLIIGVGLISFIQLVLFIRHLIKWKVKFSRLFVYTVGVIVLVFDLFIALLTRHAHPGYIHSLPLILILSLIPALIVGLILSRKTFFAIGLLLFFSVISAGIVNPLYRGTGPIINSKLSNAIAAIGRSHPSYKWAVVDNLTLENLPAMAGVPSITNTYAYPQLALWAKAPEVASQQVVYNRFAHTLVRFQKSGPTTLQFMQQDFFEIVSAPCSTNFFKEEGVRYFVAQNDYSKVFSCLQLDKTITYPANIYFILQIK